MGRFDVIPLFTGTFEEVCFYQRGGRYFFRGKSSLTAERVKKDPAFAKTRYFASLLAQASGIASIVYNRLPIEGRKHRMYRQFTGEAYTWLKYGWAEQDVLEWMLKRYDKQGIIELFNRPEKLLTDKEKATRHIARANRRLLRTLRMAKDDSEWESIMEDIPRGWQQHVEDWYSDE